MKRFPNWKPQLNERALCPGVTIDHLRPDDIEAIKNGHRGYVPLRLGVYSPNGECLDLIVYDESRQQWESSVGGATKSLGWVMRYARQHFGVDVVLDCFTG